MQTRPALPDTARAVAAIIPGLEDPARRSTVLRVWEQALCAQVDPELFFPEKGQPSAKALAVCAACPVREDCRELFGPLLPVGVVGGTTPTDRRTGRSSRRPEAA